MYTLYCKRTLAISVVVHTDCINICKSERTTLRSRPRQLLENISVQRLKKQIIVFNIRFRIVEELEDIQVYILSVL
jgi:hypothetical protein